MRLTLLWGLATGVVIACVDALAGEVARSVGDPDLRAAVELVDMIVNLGLFGWAGFRVAAALGELRAGLEAAVLAGGVAGLAGIGYQLARPTEPPAIENLVALLAWNIVLAAVSGSLGAWAATMRRPQAPPR
jgi:hypothetical protein